MYETITKYKRGIDLILEYLRIINGDSDINQYNTKTTTLFDFQKRLSKEIDKVKPGSDIKRQRYEYRKREMVCTKCGKDYLGYTSSKYCTMCGIKKAHNYYKDNKILKNKNPRKKCLQL